MLKIMLKSLRVSNNLTQDELAKKQLQNENKYYGLISKELLNI